MDNKNIAKFEFKGNINKIIYIYFTNIFLKIATLGIHSFWGKTRMRRYVTASVLLDGEPFEYLGNGKELFWGFLKAALIFIPAFLVYNILCKFLPALGIATPVLVFYIFHMGFFAAFRYRASRLSWRGIRFKLEGSAFKYGCVAIKRSLLNILTLGLKLPESHLKLHQYMISKTFYGNQPFSFSESFISEGTKNLRAINLKTLLLAPFTFGLSRIWYHRDLTQYVWENSFLNNIRILPRQAAIELFFLDMGNVFIGILTLGLGAPWIIRRNIVYFTKHYAIEGNLNQLEHVSQSDEKLTGTGEGVEAFFGNSGF